MLAALLKAIYLILHPNVRGIREKPPLTCYKGNPHLCAPDEGHRQQVQHFHEIRRLPFRGHADRLETINTEISGQDWYAANEPTAIGNGHLSCQITDGGGARR